MLLMGLLDWKERFAAVSINTEYTESQCLILQVLTSALQIHPSASGLWSYAAAWEFEGNKNPSAARILMQEGLRACKNDPLLWLEYFKMELVHAHKLVTRRKILGISSTGTPPPASCMKVIQENSSTCLQVL